MFNSQSTPTDPRERLITVGNELLDAVYALEATSPQIDQMKAAQNDQGALSDLMNDGGVEVLIAHLKAVGERDKALREYVTIRQTIESLTGVTR